MKKQHLSLYLWIVLCCLTGCQINVDINLKLNEDGSGTYSERTRFGGMMAEMLKDPTALLSDSLKLTLPPDSLEKLKGMDFCSEEAQKNKEKVSKMGEGVTLINTEKITDDPNAIGCFAEYSFKDINTFKPSWDQTTQETDMPFGKNDLRFKYAQGALTILQTPNSPKKAKKAEPSKPIKKDDIEMMKSLLSEMKVAFHIQLPKPIISTNARYKTDRSISLVDVDFSKMFAGTDAQVIARFNRMQQIQKLSPAAQTAAIAKFPGMKIDSQKSITIRF